MSEKNTNDSEVSSSLHDLIIVGSGPAGLTAGIYAARARLNPILFAGEPWGGQLMYTTDVENYPGFTDGISGPELMQNMMDQAQKFGAEVIYKNVDFVDLSGEEKIIKVGEDEYRSKSVIFATGSKAKMLGVPGEEEYFGRGVSTCATCDGAFYKDKVVAVVGGGDSAMEESTFLTRFASKVYIIHRRDEFRASEIMQERALNNEKIEVLWNTEVKEVLASEDDLVSGIKIFNNKDNKESELELSGLFLAIGHFPSTGFLKDKGIELDPDGYVQTLRGGPITNIPGVFIAGEIADYKYKQAVTTAGEGCKAALEAQWWLEANEDE